MSHDEIRHRLSDYVASRLAPDQRRFVEAHVAGCAECAAEVEDVRRIQDQIARHGEAMFAPHPDPSLLRRFAVEQGVASDPAVARHLEVCPSCRVEADHWTKRGAGTGAARMTEAATTAVGAAVGRTGAAVVSGAPAIPAAPSEAIGATPDRRAAWMALGMAAALFVGGFLGLRIGRQQQTGGSSPTTAAAPARDDRVASVAGTTPSPKEATAAGEVVLHVLPLMTRGQTGPAQAWTLPGKQAEIPVLVPLVLPPGTADAARFRFELHRVKGGAAWSVELPAARIREHLEAAEGVLLSVRPASVLDPGEYEFTVRDSATPGAEPIYRVSISVAYRQSPAETNAPQ